MENVIQMAYQGSSEASSRRNFKYEVFISFRGEDTRHNFTDHLYHALIKAGVVTFRDDDELQKGEDISSELFEAIKHSKSSIVVFSKNYASSRWCLNELVNILKYINRVIPIFNGVKPSDVRKQRGSYGDAFIEYEQDPQVDSERIQMWRQALTKAANIGGWDLRFVRSEAVVIHGIVDGLVSMLDLKRLHVVPYAVALESRVADVISMLRVRSDGVRIVGIHGMGGGGKTTIAKAVYNFVCPEFGKISFLPDIKDISKQPGGLASLQQQLLRDILNLKSIRIHNIDRGINLIHQRLCHLKVLVVLDDVDDLKQLKFLVGNRNWFGQGSRIIITTRDKRLLNELEVDATYSIELLNLEESIRLFSLHAFKRPNPKNEYIHLCKEVAEYAQGLPLALQVLGSHLSKRNGRHEMEIMLKELQQIPHGDILKILRISFDALDDCSKAIFLDIACFFYGMDKDYVMKILDGCGFLPVSRLNVLLERSLITIDRQDNKIRMHGLLQDMGREVVRETSPFDLSKRSRLWFHDDIVDVLRKRSGGEAVQGLSLDGLAREDASTEAFARMINLRLLKINSVHFANGSYENFSRDIRWLCWHRCTLRVLPPNLDLENLVVLDMRFSNVRKVWKGTKILHKLKILDLSHSIYLTETPNFAGLLSLEKLEFEGCTSLIKVHESIGQLEKLVSLNLSECSNLRELPDDGIWNVRSLNTLNLNGCSKLNRLPKHLDKCEALETIHADGCAITQLPDSIGSMKNLKRLSLAGPGREGMPSKSFFSFSLPWISRKRANSFTLPGTFSQLTSLVELNLSHRKLSDNDISIDFGNFQFLHWLDLGGNKFYNLPDGISDLPRLKRLKVDNCTNLQVSPKLPPKLQSLEARQCTSMCRYPNLFNLGENMMQLVMTNCHKPVDAWDLHRRHLQTPGNSYSWREPDPKGIIIESKERHVEGCIPSKEVPDWFDYKVSGSSVLFHAPPLPRFIGTSASVFFHDLPLPLVTDRTRAMIVCVVYSVEKEYNGSTDDDSLTIHFRNKSKDYETFDKPHPKFFDTNICGDHTWICYLTSHIINELKMEEGDAMKVSVEAHGRIIVNQCGIHLPIHDLHRTVTTIEALQEDGYESD